VVEQGTNAPLSGVKVEASKVGSTAVVASATTNTSGQYSLTADRNATHNLKFTKSGYVEQAKTNVNLVGATLTMADVAMAPSGGGTGDFAGGDGSALNPYQVSTPQQLDNVRNCLKANFILINDINLASWGNWEPIGGSSFPGERFEGVFNGNGHIIKTMTVDISSGSSAYAGLFGYAHKSKISNLGLIGNTITSSSYAGGIAGYASSASVSNCYSTGNVTASAFAGGIVGDIDSSSISNCYNTGNITATAGTAGGIAGGIFSTSSVSACYNKGNVTSSTTYFYSDPSAGGIAGVVYASSILDCYNAGNVSTSSLSSYAYSGGITGHTQNSSVINCYNTGIVYTLASSYISPGGIGGSTFTPYTSFSNCYYLNNIANAVGDNSGLLTNVNALTSTQMKQQASFVGFDFTNTWAISPSINSGYPYLRGMQP